MSAALLLLWKVDQKVVAQMPFSNVQYFPIHFLKICISTNIVQYMLRRFMCAKYIYIYIDFMYRSAPLCTLQFLLDF